MADSKAKNTKSASANTNTNVQDADFKETTAKAQMPPQLQLDVNDLKVVLDIIRIAQSKGVFEPNQLVTVGSTYDKINARVQFEEAKLQEIEQNQETADNGGKQ